MRPFTALARLDPYPLLRRHGGGALIAPFYHVVSDAPVPHATPLYPIQSEREFEQGLDFLLRHFTPVDLHAVVDSLRGGRPLPPNAFFLSTDDGMRENHDVIAPILKRKGIPATFFLSRESRILLGFEALLILHQQPSLFLGSFSGGFDLEPVLLELKSSVAQGFRLEA